MARITVTKLSKMKSGKTSEKVGSRGDGVLLIECTTRGVKEIYYRYRDHGKDTRIKIGNYSNSGGVGMSLAEARQEAVKMACLKMSYPDLKTYLCNEKRRLLIDEKAEARDCEGIKNYGTLSDLLYVYISSLKHRKKVSTESVRYHLDLYVLRPFPDLAQKEARNIIPEDIVKILRRMIKCGITTGVNRVRSYLSAAFNYTLRNQHDPRLEKSLNKNFELSLNPVKEIPSQRDYERVRDRALCDEELSNMWNNMVQVPSVGFLTSSAIKFIIACGGQRPQQLMNCCWADYDLKRKTVKILDRKGGRLKKNIIPLSELAISILMDVRVFTSELNWPFTSNGRAPLSVNSLSTAVRRYIRYQKNQEHFVLKDIRRTCKRLMVDAMIARDTRNLIQGHALTGIDFKHYDHGDHLPEKRNGMELYTKYLYSIVELEDK